MSTADTFEVLGIALALGLLVGLQRERVEAPLAGLRTFALITVLGAICGLLAQPLGAWVVAAGLVGVSAVVVVGNVITMGTAKRDVGITTEIAILLMFIVGAFVVFGPREVAVVVGGGTAVLLHAKGPLHGIVKRLADADMRAMMEFALVGLVILPIMPDEPYGPFQVLNPRQIWWMVVLVVGISFGGYLALKFVGEHAGVLLSGVLGGVISSTATSVSYARRAAHSPGQVAAAALVIMLASAVVKVRVLFEVAVVAPQQFWRIAPPIMVLFVVTIGLSLALWVRNRRAKAVVPPSDNPAELTSALIFGAMYAVVLFAVAAAQHWFGNRGIFVVAGLSGLTDMDAITLSTSRMAQEGSLSPGIAWRAIIIGSIANMMFKGAIIGVLGGRRLFARVAVLFAIASAVGVALIVWWPWGEG
jgi:uncharacterized membrane protein (DUF4010 family)